MRFCPTCQRCFQAEIQFCLYDQSPTREVRDVPLVLEGKYRLERLIAHGGMGSVYRGVHEQLERPVAIKILRAEYLQDDTVCARFHREALAAARLKHPNIIAVYDFGALPSGGVYLVMELVEGRSLREEIRLNAARNGQMRAERAAAIMRQVCAGIEAAHQSGIIHRDLKPDNIMIEPLAANDLSGSSERVLVLDFGIAKLKQLEGAWQGLTEENVIIGTPNYISPEQCAGAPVEARSDVYALGVILYEMLTGRVPFNNVSTSAVLLSHLQDTPVPPTKYRPDLSPAVERVMLRALAKNPLHRFASAAQLADALTRAVMQPTRQEAEEEWPEELPPTPRNIDFVDEPATRPRQARQAMVADAVAAQSGGQWAEPSIPDGKIERRSIFGFGREDSRADENSNEADTPQLLMEAPPRRGLWVTLLLFVCAATGMAVYFSNVTIPYDWQVNARNFAASFGLMNPAPTPQAVRPSLPTVAATPELAVAQPSESAPTATPPVVEVATAALTPEALEKEVRAFYRQWAQSALDQDWAAHAQAYAEQVDYYRDGNVARANVMTRKQRVLSGLQRTYLKFSTAPQVTLRERDGAHEAELTFDKTWDLLRGKQRSTGKAQTQLTLRRVTLQPAVASSPASSANSSSNSSPGSAGEWQIVRERQLKLYESAGTPEAQAVTAKAAVPAKAAAKPVKPAPVVPVMKAAKGANPPKAQAAPAKKTKPVEDSRPRVVPRPKR